MFCQQLSPKTLLADFELFQEPNIKYTYAYKNCFIDNCRLYMHIVLVYVCNHLYESFYFKLHKSKFLNKGKYCRHMCRLL